MIKSRVILLILLAIMLSGFGATFFGMFDLGAFIILIGAIGYFIFNKKE